MIIRGRNTLIMIYQEERVGVAFVMPSSTGSSAASASVFSAVESGSSAGCAAFAAFAAAVASRDLASFYNTTLTKVSVVPKLSTQ